MGLAARAASWKRKPSEIYPTHKGGAGGSGLAGLDMKEGYCNEYLDEMERDGWLWMDMGPREDGSLRSSGGGFFFYYFHIGLAG